MKKSESLRYKGRVKLRDDEIGGENESNSDDLRQMELVDDRHDTGVQGLNR